MKYFDYVFCSRHLVMSVRIFLSEAPGYSSESYWWGSSISPSYNILHSEECALSNLRNAENL